MASEKKFVKNKDKSGKELSRNNHYVPQWYQRGFTIDSNQLQYLDLMPEKKRLPNGEIIKFNDRKTLPPSQCFFEYDLYTTFFGPFISDMIERKLFGKIDDDGSRAVRAFINRDEKEQHDRFLEFFSYIDAQKTRTPKGLNWLKDRYSKLDQVHLMMEMEAVQRMHCTIWLEGVREMVSAKKANVKFIVSDHPVTIYNYACPPESQECKYPNDPSIAWKASQTIFPLDKDHCLILTNYEYASQPSLADPMNKRTNARNFAETLVRTNAFIRERELNDKEVQEINFVIKKRARRFIAAAQKDWLYPEKNLSSTWESIKLTLLPPANKIYKFGGDMFVGYKDGRIYSQDPFGRTLKPNPFLEKELPNKEPSRNDSCPCGQGRKYKKCCMDKAAFQRPAWGELSIRERNMIFYSGINDILGFSQGKKWDDIRKEINNEQVKDIHQLFGELWPVHTDIVSLLPKPDKHIRAIYTGVIDPRVITTYATSATLYFNELIVYNPFINPAGFNPEYSPVEHPSMFRQQTLMNLALFLTLYPLIYSGKINLIPDLGVFNRHLQSQLLDMAKRHDDILEIEENDSQKFKELLEDDHNRSLWGLSDEQQRKLIKDAVPEATEELVNGAYELWQKMRDEDPLALLQNDLYSNGGQITIMNMAPNFEIALFLAQVTGGIIFTDSSIRWKQITRPQHKDGFMESNEWSELIEYIRNLELPFSLDVETSIMLWQDGKFGKMRRVWQNIYTAILSTTSSDIKKVTDQLKTQIVGATKDAHKDMSLAETSILKKIDSALFNAQFDCIIPSGGIENNNVARLLVTCGVENYAKSVPMAIFARKSKL